MLFCFTTLLLHSHVFNYIMIDEGERSVLSDEQEFKSFISLKASGIWHKILVEKKLAGDSAQLELVFSMADDFTRSIKEEMEDYQDDESWSRRDIVDHFVQHGYWSIEVLCSHALIDDRASDMKKQFLDLINTRVVFKEEVAK